MQAKMMNGFHEAYRVLKSNGYTIYTKSVVENHENENSQKYGELPVPDTDKFPYENESNKRQPRFILVDIIEKHRRIIKNRP
ncbi:hypothetical protein Ana3638_20795 [Anaerocolumna sedimenticola]|uniref:Uncharacterized protein n=1 Tax=Anaerocolumna sedimenticola TaxID=2696063 RepID=A0A6P1TU04_9FIRM|nr:hypothetical protein [Anaerocolumna sedimenticola]QHQ62915.1 hypothetical protein Ana3638_20795 [Anaerocolumna sedimenticola]